MREAQDTGPVDRRSGWGEAFAEVTLVMPNQQLEALELAASTRGVTTGHLLRRLIRDCLGRRDSTPPS